MTAFATAADLAARWRPLAPSETTTATTLLDDASDIIRARVIVSDGDAAQAKLLKIVCCNMVRRAMEAHSDAFGFDGTGGAETWLPENPAGGLRLYDSEAALLSGFGNGLFSVRASR